MKIVVFLVALFASAGLYAQATIKGLVVTERNEALPGASVVVSGTTQGTVANANGRFEIEVENGAVLKVSFVGYEEKIVDVVENSREEFVVVLKKSARLTEDVFVYGTRAGQKVPVTSSMLEKEEIEERNLGQDIPYLLSSTPSFVSSSDAGAGVGYTSFRIRGTDANRVNVTINGIPVNDSESHGVWWVNMPDFSSSIENVQVQRGVGTSTQGAAAFGASINMQTNNVRQNAYAEYSGAAGSFSTMKNTVRVGTGLLKDHFSVDVRLSKIKSDGFVDRAFTDLKSFFVSGGYYADNTILKLNIFSGQEKTYQAWWGAPSVLLNNDVEGMQRYEDHWLYTAKQTAEMLEAAETSPRTYNYYTYENETDNYQQDHYQLLLTQQFGENLNLNAALHYTKGEGYYEQFREGDDFADYALENYRFGEEIIESTDLVRQKWLDNDFYGGTFSLIHKKDNSDITLGGGWNRYEGHHFGNIIWAQFAGNAAKDFEWYRSVGDKMDFNVYLKYNYALTEALNLYADVQYRNILYTIDGIDDDLRDLTQSHEFDFINPKLGVFYQLNDASKAYASWSVGHREPSRSNFTDADPNAEVPRFETLNDFEAGYEYKSEKFALGANAYYMLYDDQLILTGEINDVGSAIMVNVDDSYRAGIELIGGLQIVSNLNWKVNASFSQNKILNFTEYVDNWDTWGQDQFEMETTTIAFSPSVVANSTLIYEPIENLKVSLLSKFVGEQYIDNTESEERVLDAYFVNKLLASYSIYPKLFSEVEFTLLVDNLLNHEYETNAWVYSYLLGGERYAMDGYFPQAGTNFLFGINLKF